MASFRWRSTVVAADRIAAESGQVKKDVDALPATR